MPAYPPDAAQSPRRSGAELSLRIASAAALAPLAFGAAWLGGWWFTAFWLAAALGVLWEWLTLTGLGDNRQAMAAGMVALVAGAIALGWGQGGLALALVLAGAALCAALASPERRLLAFGGVIYAAALALAPAFLRADAEFGFAAIVLLFAVVWGTDIAGYFAGRLIGGPKLWVRVSPKKTWSGALAGLGAAIFAGLVVGQVAGKSGDWGALGAVCALLSIASQAGDLFESALKRRFGVKDSSGLIPGHGGLMDRLDGFVLAALAAALIGLARGGLEAPARGLMIW